MAEYKRGTAAAACTDYYYSDDSESFPYIHLPRMLLEDERFCALSLTAAVAYGLLYERVRVSRKCGWTDEAGRVYVVYTVRTLARILHCGHTKLCAVLTELEEAGLIERFAERRGQRSRIYLRRLPTAAPGRTEMQMTVRSVPKCGTKVFRKTEAEHSGIRNRGVPENGIEAFRKTEYINNNIINHDIYNHDLSINHGADAMDGCDLPDGFYGEICSGRKTDAGAGDCEPDALRRDIERQIETRVLREQYGDEEVTEIAELMYDVLSSERGSLRIGGEERSMETVKRHFRALDRFGIEYVLDCLAQQSVSIRNIRAYLLTALYNAPETISHYYSAAVRRDFGA